MFSYHPRRKQRKGIVEINRINPQSKDKRVAKVDDHTTIDPAHSHSGHRHPAHSHPAHCHPIHGHPAYSHPILPTTTAS
jgi:hypothetical protein